PLCPQKNGDGSFDAPGGRRYNPGNTRQEERMATHHFQPERYYTALGTYEPVLRIADGDTVLTTTVDASGRDSTGERVTARGNPQTGPFYVEGAEPGDTLAVHFDRLRPNRNLGYTNVVLAPNVVDPWYVQEMPKAEGWDGEWEIDLHRNTATLVKPETK